MIWVLTDSVEVGTKLYIAPEVQSRKRGPRNHTKADMYSLGVRVLDVSIFWTLIGSSDCLLRNELLIFDNLRTHSGY